ncbi:MAG: hypothetical protein ACP5T9_03170 [Thermoplasmata archaeon]
MKNDFLKEYKDYIEKYNTETFFSRVEDWLGEIRKNPTFQKFREKVDVSKFWAQPYKPKMLPFGNLQHGVVKKTLVTFFTTDSAVIYYGPFGTGKTVLAEATANIYYRLLKERLDLPDFVDYYITYQMNNASTKSQIWRGDMPASENGVLTIKGFPMFLMYAYVMGNVISLDEFTQAPEDIQGFLNSIVEVGDEIDTPYGRLPVSPLRKVTIIFNPQSISNTARELAYTIENRAGRKIPVEMSPFNDILELLRNVVPDAPDFLRRYVTSLVVEAREDGSNSSIRTALNLLRQLNIKFRVGDFESIHQKIISDLNIDGKSLMLRLSGRLKLKETDVLEIMKNSDYRSFIFLLNEFGVMDFRQSVKEIVQEQNWQGLKFSELLP